MPTSCGLKASRHLKPPVIESDTNIYPRSLLNIRSPLLQKSLRTSSAIPGNLRTSLLPTEAA